MSVPAREEIIAPIPKPRTRHRLSAAKKQLSLERDLTDSGVTLNQTELPSQQDPDDTGVPGTPGSVRVSGNDPCDDWQNSLGCQSEGTGVLANEAGQKCAFEVPALPGADKSHSDSVNRELTPSPPPILFTSANEAHPTVDEPSANGRSHSSDSPPLSTEVSMDSLLLDLAESFIDLIYVSSHNEDEALLSLAAWRPEDQTSVKTEVRQGPQEPVTGNTGVGGVVSDKRPLQPNGVQTGGQAKPPNKQSPRTATIRVSRKKTAVVECNGGTQATFKESAVSRSSWLDVWQGRRHHVLWATLDGQLMSLWKKRTDKFPEVVFHVSSITNVQTQDRARFSVYFGKKHIDFMAHSEAVWEGWMSSLHASRGHKPPPPSEHQGPLTMKDPRCKVYAAICGHSLWIYRNKEDFGLGVGMTHVSMNVASVKQTGRHTFSVVTPYKSFNFSADTSRDLASWRDRLTEVIRSALSCSEVANRLWANPCNKVCADCGSAAPEWASVNLLVVICEACAGQHRSLGINVSKVRSLKLDSKVWTEPLIQLFILYGNTVANNVWGHNVPAPEQILPDTPPKQRAAFIRAKYREGRYRRIHPLASSQKLLNQRLCEVVCGPDVPETVSLLCSGAQVLCQTGDAQCPSPISLAESAGQAMQTELLRHNEFIEVPANDHAKLRNPVLSSSSAALGQEELHGKLEEDRFLFSLENDSAACDVLDLREVVAIFECSRGSTLEFEVLTLTDKLLCSAFTKADYLTHLTHILKVVLPGPVPEGELEGVCAVSRVSLWEGGDLQHAEVWVALRRNQVLVYPTERRGKDLLVLTGKTGYNLHSSEKTIELVTETRTVSIQFEQEQICLCWDAFLKLALSNAEVGKRQSLYQLPASVCGKVPPAMERCISHITQYGLKVEGIYRRCGMATKISQLVEALISSPAGVKLDPDEMGVLETAGAFKQFVRQKVELIPNTHFEEWVKAAAHADENKRLEAYRGLLEKMPPDNRVSLAALCEHLYTVQIFSKSNRMTAHNLAVVFVPTLFQDLAMNPDMVRLTQELILHCANVFQGASQEISGENEVLMTAM